MTSALAETKELEALEHIMSDGSADPMKLSSGFLRMITENFCHEIGRGAFGVVYQGALENGDVAVMKLLNLHSLTEQKYLDVITILKGAKHKNIVRFLGYCSETQAELLEQNGSNVMEKEKEMLLCFEYVPNGNIKHYLQQEKSHVDDWPLRYQMIRGICQGLYYLHGEHINHLDLKPENVMLDAHMEPKITNFGLARCFEQDQSKITTQNKPETLRYIAPETIEIGEMSCKSDIYALGIIIIELLSGIDNISLDNWDESLDDRDCPRFRRCTEIARNCTDRDKYNRPSIADVIIDLQELESRIPPPSSINQVGPTTSFPWFEIVDVYPIELSFPFVPNQEMHCQLAVANKTNGIACFAIRSEYPERYLWDKHDFRTYYYLPPACTRAVTVYRQAVEELPPHPDKLEIIVITGLNKNEMVEKLSTLSLHCTHMDVTFEVAQLMGFELHVVDLTAVVVGSEEDDRALVVDTTYTCWEGDFHFDAMDVHPTEPWVLIVGYARDSRIFYIWNWQTNEKMGEHRMLGEYRSKVAKFVAQKQCVVIGGDYGSILVGTCPTLDHFTQFRAHPANVTALAVHPTWPFLLSSCNNPSVKLWNWSHGWSCENVYEVNASMRKIRKIMFHPTHARAFMTVHENGSAMDWRLRHLTPVTIDVSGGKGEAMYTYLGDRQGIAAINGRAAAIDDLKKNGKPAHSFHITENIVDIICNPTRRILVTVSLDGFIHIWDYITYR